jgi:hypothetical protein
MMMNDDDDETLLEFSFPTEVAISKMSKEERMNIFRGFFATSRYNRLLIQKILLRCALDDSFYPKVIELEANRKMIERYGFREEFIAAVKEEDAALDKIIDAYNKRMMKTRSCSSFKTYSRIRNPSDQGNTGHLQY